MVRKALLAYLIISAVAIVVRIMGTEKSRYRISTVSPDFYHTHR